MAAANQSIFQADEQSMSQFAAALQAGARAALLEAWKTLQAWGQEYKRRVEQVTPVDRGAARQSWLLVAERSADSMTVTLANSARGAKGQVPYAFYREFGTDRIAGDRVGAWQPGDAAVTEWPAKTGEPPERPHFGEGSRERHVDVISHAFAATSAAQMPMLRPIGYELAPEIVASLQQALVTGFQSAARSGERTE